MRQELALHAQPAQGQRALDTGDGCNPVKGKLRKAHCCVCGIKFGITAALRRQRMKDGRDFYCPNGHRQRFVGNGRSRGVLQEQLARTLHEKEQLEARLDSCRPVEAETDVQESRAAWSFGFWRAFRRQG